MWCSNFRRSSSCDKWLKDATIIAHQTRFGALRPWSAPKWGLSQWQTSLWRTPSGKYFGVLHLECAKARCVSGTNFALAHFKCSAPTRLPLGVHQSEVCHWYTPCFDALQRLSASKQVWWETSRFVRESKEFDRDSNLIALSVCFNVYKRFQKLIPRCVVSFVFLDICVLWTS